MVRQVVTGTFPENGSRIHCFNEKAFNLMPMVSVYLLWIKMKGNFLFQDQEWGTGKINEMK